MAEAGKSTRDIAQVAHVPLRTLGPHSEDVLLKKRNLHREKGFSTCSRAFKLFNEGNILVDTAIALDMETVEVLEACSDYLRLMNLQN